MLKGQMFAICMTHVVDLMESAEKQDNDNHCLGIPKREPWAIVELEGSLYIKIISGHIMIDPCLSQLCEYISADSSTNV